MFLSHLLNNNQTDFRHINVCKTNDIHFLHLCSGIAIYSGNSRRIFVEHVNSSFCEILKLKLPPSTYFLLFQSILKAILQLLTKNPKLLKNWTRFPLEWLPTVNNVYKYKNFNCAMFKFYHYFNKWLVEAANEK